MLTRDRLYNDRQIREYDNAPIHYENRQIDEPDMARGLWRFYSMSGKDR